MSGRSVLIIILAGLALFKLVSAQTTEPANADPHVGSPKKLSNQQTQEIPSCEAARVIVTPKSVDSKDTGVLPRIKRETVKDQDAEVVTLPKEDGVENFRQGPPVTNESGVKGKEPESLLVLRGGMYPESAKDDQN